jgi:glycosyltransferase involved in cell wall biosynthesis
MNQPKSPSILYVSTFPPRECGIATFTQDLINAIDREFAPAVKSKVLAMNPDGISLYNYSRKVSSQIRDSDIEDYIQAANEINRSSDIKLVNIQHEYGIYGGDWGNYILPFLELINKPIVVTFHTILPRPDKHLKKITQDIVAKASGIVVMTKHAAKQLRTTYKINSKKPIAIIPHGVHHVPYPSKSRAKTKLQLSGHTILSTFGMLNPDKGIEYAIEALPKLVEKHPDLLYLVLGATHPNVVKECGEVYRNKLVRLVKKLGLDNHVKFYNKYLDLSELIDFLKATDIYISPTLNPRQAVSGTISYAFSCACPIVATANQYAKDTIGPTRGSLVDFADAEAIEQATMSILDDPKMASEMKKDAYYYSRHMTWQNVALAYFKFFNDFAKITPREQDKLPAINLSHLRTLTDDFGMIQFASHTKPDNHSGYCLDDNVRALLGCVKLYNTRPSASLLRLINIYFAYLKLSQRSDGHFNDFINHNKTINKELPESQDSFGRAIWSLGVTINSRKLPSELITSAIKVFNKSLPTIKNLDFSRAIAFSLLGLTASYHYFHKQGDLKKSAQIFDLMKNLADKLLAKYAEQAAANTDAKNIWRWFDDSLTYSNYKIPEALFAVSGILNDQKYLQVAEESIDFLAKVSFDKEYYNAIGQDGWYFRNGKRAYFDQQPEDAASAVEALVEAYKVTNSKKYASEAKLAFGWFLGKNHLNQMIYDEATGGCYDGLGKHSINFNQGAESTISYFLARLAIEQVYTSIEQPLVTIFHDPAEEIELGTKV